MLRLSPFQLPTTFLSHTYPFDLENTVFFKSHVIMAEESPDVVPTEETQPTVDESAPSSDDTEAPPDTSDAAPTDAEAPAPEEAPAPAENKSEDEGIDLNTVKEELAKVATSEGATPSEEAEAEAVVAEAAKEEE
jgi:hypothetical protein